MSHPSSAVKNIRGLVEYFKTAVALAEKINDKINGQQNFLKSFMRKKEFPYGELKEEVQSLFDKIGRRFLFIYFHCVNYKKTFANRGLIESFDVCYDRNLNEIHCSPLGQTSDRNCIQKIPNYSTTKDPNRRFQAKEDATYELPRVLDLFPNSKLSIDIDIGKENSQES